MIPDHPTGRAFHEASEAAKTVWLDTATMDPPMGVEDRLDAVLEAFVQVLRANGYMTDPEYRPTGEELDDQARWLAARSAFPRYTDGEGWRLLRERAQEVEIAYHKAVQNLTPGDDTLTRALSAARRLLAGHATHSGGNR